MKSYKVMSWLVLVNVGALGACGGTSTIGNGGDQSMGGGGGTKAGGSSGASTGMGATTGSGAKPGTGMGATSGMGTGTPGTGNTGMGASTGTGASTGMGATSGTGACMSDRDCGEEQCEACEGDGGIHCTRGACVGGKCRTYDIAPCATTCSDDGDCGALDMGCTDCGNGSQACQTSKCAGGFCQTTFQGCAEPNDCAGQPCGAICKTCTTGTCDPMQQTGVCSVDGKCTQEEPRCVDSCATSMDCGTTPPMCIDCGDGMCKSFQCVDKKCVLGCDTEVIESQCKVNEDCPAPEDSCTKCDNGSAMCAVPACLQGSCQLVCPVQ